MNEFTIQKLHNIEELRRLVALFSLVFETRYDVKDDYLEKMLANDAVVILGVLKDAEIVGGLAAFEMTLIHGSKELYIYDMAVHPAHQKQGLGKKLIAYLKEEAKKRGIKTIFVAAESEDTGAVAFYRAIGGEEVTVNHFNFDLE